MRERPQERHPGAVVPRANITTVVTLLGGELNAEINRRGNPAVRERSCPHETAGLGWHSTLDELGLVVDADIRSRVSHRGRRSGVRGWRFL